MRDDATEGDEYGPGKYSGLHADPRDNYPAPRIEHLTIRYIRHVQEEERAKPRYRQEGL
jgi:hypothetical protein